MKIFGKLWNAMKTYENLWKSMKIDNPGLESLRPCRSLWQPLATCGGRLDSPIHSQFRFWRPPVQKVWWFDESGLEACSLTPGQVLARGLDSSGWRMKDWLEGVSTCSTLREVGGYIMICHNLLHICYDMICCFEEVRLGQVCPFGFWCCIGHELRWRNLL